eukprot:GFUD01034792.1.p1 GENE.GFUD01034792.1~~GFUD01034792.1.p1  ORF type:complete len:480 (+),score=151.99 GFUD01034792.1:35-1474(+)
MDPLTNTPVHQLLIGSTSTSAEPAVASLSEVIKRELLINDEFSKKSTSLSDEQETLIHLPEHDLSKPRIVPGMARTGKTLAVCEKLKQLDRNGLLTEKTKALYICFSDHMLDQVRMWLLHHEVSVNCVELKNYEAADDIQEFYKNQEIMKKSVIEQGFKFVFFDQAEDLGIEELTVICQELESSSEIGIMGHYWILFDVFQSKTNIHKIEMIGEKRPRLLWNGKLINEKRFEAAKNGGHVWPLKTVFGSTESIFTHIKEKHLIPNLENVNCTDNKGTAVKFEMVTSADDTQVSISQLICQTVLPTAKSIFDKQILPGHTALLFDDDVMDIAFSMEKENLENFKSHLDAQMEPIFDNNHKTIRPKATQDIKESILNESSTNYFVGAASSLKGLTVKAVIYLSISSNRRPKEITRTSSYYQAISRASCEAHVLDLHLTEKMESSLNIPEPDIVSGLDPEVYDALARSYKLGQETRGPVVKR